ncbi:hypothetical protein BOX15_Mlig003098g2 [Macrostomum lignano]|uniref:Uncharacterized protein n=1 Tax=Macrostomum lignano TaxID=282301 RepID=A0A267FMY1_9PLAT|nr:hypothetical protein BOX15_Mlig003098g2 [Macrostomum lignano]
MSLLDIADFNPNLFGKHGDTEKKEDDDEEAATAAAAIATSAGSASASAGGPPAAAVSSSSEDESDRSSEASRRATRARQQRQQLKQQQLKQQKAKPAPKAASSGGKRRGRLSDSDDEQKPQQLKETEDASSNSSSPAAASSTSESSKRLPHQRRHTAPVKQQRAGRTGSGSGGGESLRAAIEDDPELWGVRRSGRSRQKPTRLAVGHEDEEDSDEAGGGHPQHPHPQQQQLFAQRKRRRGSASASGGKRRRRSGVTFSLSDEDNGANSSDDDDGGSSTRLNSAAAAGSSSDDDATSSSSSSLPAPAAARKRRRGGSAASAQSQKKQRQLRSSRRSSGRVRSYRELSTSGEDAKVDASSDDGDYVAESAAPRRSQQQQQQHGQRSSGGGQLKPSNKLHPMLRTATDAPPRQAAGTRGAGKRPETSDSDDSDNDNEPDLAGEPSQEEMEARLSHSDFLAPPTEDAEGIERVLNYRVGRKGATGDKTTFYNVLEERDPNDGFDPSQEDGDVQFFIKWRGWSHLHNTWESMDSLAHKCVDGLKKIVNFKQRIEEIREWKKTATPEELESFNYHEEVNENLLAEHRQVERVVAHSKAPAGGYSDYYCKWAGLPYSECSWEDGQLVTKLFLSAVEEYETRLKAQTLPNRNCKALKYRPKFRQLKSQPKYMSPENAENRLRDYQLDGVNWLYHSWTRGYSSILADEMGLGKTIQTICFLSVLFHEHEIYGPFLLVVPLSTVIGWKREFANWAPQMNVILYLGDVDSRNIIRSYEWQQVNRRLKFNVCLTTYEILLKDRGWLGAVSWALLGVDEAHRLKNDDSLLYKTLIDFKTNTRLLVTGTPLQNSLRELWALLHFIQPDTFHSWPDFEEDHGDNNKGFEGLHKLLEPYLLRRVKKDVEKSLPPKTESILRVEMSRQQKQFYKWILTRNYKMLNKPNAFLNLIMELKKCCNHTFLVQEPPQLTDRCERLESLIRGSGKMLLLDKLLWNLRAGGHRVLIFSQMVMMLDVLAEYLSLRNWAFQRLDGTILGEARKQALDAFNAESSQDFCFLLSTRAGGLGVNLASADTVVIFDSDWNPQNDLQAMARCHRIGQTRQVRVYRLVLRATVEEDIIERAKQKMVLDHLVIQRMDTTGRLRQPGDAGNPAFSKDELSAILKFGAADLFREKEGEESEAEVDLDAILRSAETREELQPTSAAAEELLSQFKVVNLENLEDTEIIMSGGGPSGRRKGQATATAAGDSAGQSAEPAASKTWEEIIPEESRRRIEQEEAEERLLQLELGPRQRKQVKPLNVGAEDEEELSDREIRALAKAMRKFASPLDRLDSVVEEAELQEKSETEVRRLVEAILQGCERAVAKAATFATGEEASAKPSAPSFTLGRVVIQARPLLQSQKDLAPLHREMPADREARRKYRVPFYTKTVTWDCVWDEIDDSNLLIGVYEFGMDSWDAIKDDPDLGLRAKILRDHNLKPQAAHLRTRTDYLLKMLQRHQEGGTGAGGAAGSAGAVSGGGGRRSKPSGASVGAAGKDQSQQQQQQQQQQHQQQQPISKEFVDSSDSSSSSSAAQSRSNSPAASGSRALHITANRQPVSIHKSKQQQHPKKQQKSGQPVKSKEQQQPQQQQQKKPGKQAAGKPGGDAEEQRLPESVFNACKEHMRPLKKTLKRLQDCEADRDGNLIGAHLLKIGSHIGHEIRQFRQPDEIRAWRNRLWTFVSYFTELSHSELHRLYKKHRKEAKANKQHHHHHHHHHQHHGHRQHQHRSDARVKRADSNSASSAFNNAYNRRPSQPGGKHY